MVNTMALALTRLGPFSCPEIAKVVDIVALVWYTVCRMRKPDRCSLAHKLTTLVAMTLIIASALLLALGATNTH